MAASVLPVIELLGTWLSPAASQIQERAKDCGIATKGRHRRETKQVWTAEARMRKWRKVLTGSQDRELKEARDKGSK